MKKAEILTLDSVRFACSACPFFHPDIHAFKSGRWNEARNIPFWCGHPQIANEAAAIREGYCQRATYLAVDLAESCEFARPIGNRPRRWSLLVNGKAVNGCPAGGDAQFEPNQNLDSGSRITLYCSGCDSAKKCAKTLPIYGPVTVRKVRKSATGLLLLK